MATQRKPTLGTVAPPDLYKKEFDYGGCRYRVVQQVGHDLTVCRRIDHGTGRGLLVDFDTNFVFQCIEIDGQN